MSFVLEDLLMDMIERGSSDLFLKAGSSPNIRVDGEIAPLDYGSMMPEDTATFARDLMSENQWNRFQEVPEMDLAVGLSGVGRFRVNCFRQRGSVGMVLRHIGNPEFDFSRLNLPPVVRELSARKWGLTLVTGMTGAGKSMTLAAMINHINLERRCPVGYPPMRRRRAGTRSRSLHPPAIRLG